MCGYEYKYLKFAIDLNKYEYIDLALKCQLKYMHD